MTSRAQVAPGTPVISNLAVVPATVGEVWIVAYLLLRGVRPAATAAGPAPLCLTYR